MSADLAGLVLGGRYHLERRLGQGGMADVYRGMDLRLGRQVAVKLPHSHLAENPAYVERLRQEARAIAALSHTNIVAVYDQGEADGRLFLVMELVEGESLDSLLGRQRPLPTARVVEIVLDVLAALEHAHARGIVHRDVKPQNVLLTAEGRAKLADFGIALTKDAAALTAAGELLGSIHYVAPERLSGQPASPGADVYSVGVLLYQMVAGQLPFEGDSTVAIAAQHHQRDPEPPSARRPELPAWVDEVVLRALAKDPSKRYTSAPAMRDDLSRHLAAHSAPTETIHADQLAASQPQHPSKGPLVTRERTSRRTAIYAAALGAVVLISSLTLLLAIALSPSVASTTVVPGTPTLEANGATFAAKAPVAAASEKTSPTPRATATPPAPPTATPAPPTPTPAPPTATPTPTVDRRLAALLALVQSRTPRGEAGKEEREITKKLEEIEKEIDEDDTKEAAEKIRDLIKEVREKASEREIDRDLSEQLIEQLTELAAQVR